MLKIICINLLTIMTMSAILAYITTLIKTSITLTTVDKEELHDSAQWYVDDVRTFTELPRAIAGGARVTDVADVVRLR